MSGQPSVRVTAEFVFKIVIYASILAASVLFANFAVSWLLGFTENESPFLLFRGVLIGEGAFMVYTRCRFFQSPIDRGGSVIQTLF